MKINIREVNREWAVDLETPDKIQSIYFKSRQNALSFVKYLELADNVIKLDKKELQTPMTNYDRIKAMSVEEMADFIKSVALGLNSDWVRGNIQEWLEQEVSE